MRAAELDKPARSASSAVNRLRWAAVAVAFLLPLVVLPGAEKPFSTPKFVLLGAVVGLGALLTAGSGLLAWPILPRGFQVALVVWLAALGASAAFGTLASLAALLLPLFALGWFLLTLLVRPRAVSLAYALMLSGGVVAAIALLQFFGLDPFALAGWIGVGGSDRRMRVFATLGNPNFVAAFLVAIIPLTLALRTVFLRHRRLFSMLLALEALAVFATGSRATILALAAIVLWLASLRCLGRWRALALAGLALAALVLALAPTRTLPTTLRGRLYIWQVAGPHLAERLLIGFGPGAFPAKYAEWELERWHRGGASDLDRMFGGIQNHAHNDYLETLVNHGLFGLVGFLGLLLSFLAFAYQRVRQTPTDLLVGGSAGVIALAAVALVDFPLHRPTEIFVFWTLMSITFLAARSEARPCDAQAGNESP